MADEGGNYARRVFATPPERQRDPFLEAIYPGLAASGNPAALTYAPGGAEGPPTGTASAWDRLGMLASYFGNALPGRGGITFGTSPGFRGFLAALPGQYTREGSPLQGRPRYTGQGRVTPGQSPPALEPGQFKRYPVPSVVEPGGARPPLSSDELATRMQHLERQDPDMQARDLELYKKLLQFLQTPELGVSTATLPRR